MSYEQPYAELSSFIIKCHEQWKKEKKTTSELKVIFLHSREKEQEFSGSFDGLTYAQMLLQHGVKQPILMLGLAEIDWIRRTASKLLPKDSNALKVLDWQGLAYLRYEDLPECLDEAFEAAHTGVNSSLPQGVIQDRKPLCDALSSLHHFMIKNKKGALPLRKASYREVSCGEQPINILDLDPKPAFSTAWLEKLGRLWALDDLAREISPQSNGLEELKCAIIRFEQEWEKFQNANGAISDSTDSSKEKCIDDALDKIDKLDTALGVVGEKIEELQHTLECVKQRS